ncbi:MAG: DUF1934 domain-containing protein [Clostridiales bacterium]|nr:DUF1934 domain-containing protein [Clostridiales bacterium]
MNSTIKITTIQNNEQLPIVKAEAKTEETEKEYIIKYMQDKTLTEIIYIKEENKVTIEKKGIGSNIYNSKLIFEENKINKSQITTENYSLEIEIQTKSIKIQAQNDKITINLEYDINSAHNIVKVEVIC